jgi:hypothetical protein
MCWWRWRASCAVVMFLICLSASWARGEAILKLEHGPKKKAPAKSAKSSLSLRQNHGQNDAEFERYAPYLLAGRKSQPPFQVASNKKKAWEQEIQWNDKHAKKAGLKGVKGVKIARKPGSKQLQPVVMHPAAEPLPMPASSIGLPASVPVPKPLWAGLIMLGMIGIWRWWIGRRIAAE